MIDSSDKAEWQDIKTTTTVEATSGKMTASTTQERMRYFKRYMTPEWDPNVVKIVWRDIFFLALGAVALSIIGYVETNAMDPDARITVHIAGIYTSHTMPHNPSGIVDTGFILTYPLYEFLRDNRDWNDWFAGFNSVILILPTIYATYVTVWKGDYSCVFRILSVQLLRAFCGWFTYLPPDPTYVNSYYDFPDFVHCIFQDCHAYDDPETKGPKVMPFVSFFSGHVATMVVVANHMALDDAYKYWAYFMHFLNVYQIVRLLASRGHYSIDIIIGWYVAVYVSNPAGRLGRYYSKGVSWEEIAPKNATEAFEEMTGIATERKARRVSALLTRPEVQEALRKIEDGHEEEEINIQSETTARIMQEAASKMMQEQSKALQAEMERLQDQAKEAVAAMREQRLRESTKKLGGHDKKDK